MMKKSILRDFWKDMQSIWWLASLFSTDKSSEHISCCIVMPKSIGPGFWTCVLGRWQALLWLAFTCISFKTFKCVDAEPARKGISQTYSTDLWWSYGWGNFAQVVIEESIKGIVHPKCKPCYRELTHPHVIRVVWLLFFCRTQKKTFVFVFMSNGIESQCCFGPHWISLYGNRWNSSEYLILCSTEKKIWGWINERIFFIFSL